jgi:hypothetical protein
LEDRSTASALAGRFTNFLGLAGRYNFSNMFKISLIRLANDGGLPIAPVVIRSVSIRISIRRADLSKTIALEMSAQTIR